MKESIWGYAIITLGILAVGIIWFFANSTRTDQHNYYLLKESVEAAMYDAVDLSAYRKDGTIRIETEKFVENFIRRFAENADLSNEYKIEIYDVIEEPPKVSLRVSSKSETTATGEIVKFNLVNNIDAILETKYEENEVKYVSIPAGSGRSGSIDFCHTLRIPSNFTKLKEIKNISSDITREDIEYYRYGSHYGSYYTKSGKEITLVNDIDIDDVMKVKTKLAIENTSYEENVEDGQVGYKVCWHVDYECDKGTAEKYYLPFKYEVVWE